MLKKFLSVIAAVLIGITSISMVYAENVFDNPNEEDDNIYEYDVMIYGGNASGIIAAIQAAKMGKTVAVADPNPYRIGGLTTGGLGDTDIGSSGVIGGLSREFYRRVGAKYGKSEEFYFEAKVALQVLQEWAAEYNIPILQGEKLDLNGGVIKDGTDITSIRMESGKIFTAKMFIDCTYEGDLMAKADVSYIVGRESNSMYNETLNGITSTAINNNELPNGIDPYVIPGNPSSGLLKRVNPDAGGAKGAADKKVQAYNFRWNLTNNSVNRILGEKPEGYDEADYEILFRAIEKGLTADKIFKLNRNIKNSLGSGNKVDANNNSGISTDYNGMNHDYPEGDYQVRERIWKEHETYQMGLLWTVQNHERIPQSMRNTFLTWGLCKDEFTENNNWPTQLYVREAKRMKSNFVMNQNVSKPNPSIYVGDSVGMGSYHMDSHHVQYIVNDGGFVATEGGFYSSSSQYPISYRSIVPKANECTNLLVPVCVSASHAAYGSIRMEPVFMVLGQSAATAAVMAIEDEVSVQDVNYVKLSEQLQKDNQSIYTGGDSGGTVQPVSPDAIVYPIADLPVTTGPSALEYGFSTTSYANGSTKYNRVLTTKAGDYIEFEIDVAQAGIYQINTQIYTHEGRGKFKLYLPDTDEYLGGEYDQYGPQNPNDAESRVKLINFGQKELSQGKLKLRFVVTGSGQGSGYTLAFCNILLTPPTDKTVYFNSNGGSRVTGQLVSLHAVEPQKPIRDGYQFIGWYKDKNTTEPWDFKNDTVTGDVTLYAKWVVIIPETHTVSFHTNYGGGGSFVCSQHITKNGNGLVTKPADPKRTDYTFKGWYKDIEYKDLWDFNADTVTANTVLYAKWESDVSEFYTVIFESNGGSEIEPVTGIKIGGCLEEPVEPIKEGYKFSGWYKDEGLTEEWNFETDTVSGDITLYAKWIPEIPTYKKGDVNGDNDINIFDIMMIRDHIFGKNMLEGNQALAAHVNDDTEINIFDIMAIRDHIFGKNLLIE